MKKNLLFILIIVSVSSFPAFAQQKVKDNTLSGEVLPDKDALLELESTNKGLLHARVRLIQSDDAAPLSQHRAGMMVYNTATVNDVVPGIYYNNGSRWILVAGGGVTPINYNPVTYELTYVDIKGGTHTINLEEVVKAVETLTVLGYDAVAHQLSYQDEDGTPHTLDLNVGTLRFDDQTNALAYTSENGTITNIPLNNTSLSYDPSLGILRYVNTLGQLQEFNLSDVVDQFETVTKLSYDSDTHVLTYVDENNTTHAFNLDVGRLAYDNATNTLTYTTEDGTQTPLTLNNTHLSYEPLTSMLTYINTLGIEQPLDMTAIVKNLETLTTIVENTDGTFTYRDEQGDPHVINMANLETLTSIALNPDNTNIDYTDEDGVVTPLDMTAIVKNLETLTTIVENTDGTFTYRDEQGDPHVINMANLETLTSIALNPDNTNIDYTDEDGVVTPLDMTAIVKNLETLTTIVENTDGTFTYRDEQGDPHVINMANLETLTSIALNPDNTNIDYTDEDGVVTPLDMTAIVKNLETLTTIVENTDGTFTYRDEQGDPHVINMANLETLTSIALNPDNTNIDYTDEDGVVTPLDMTAIVKNLETLTTIVENTDGTFTYRDEQGDPHVINMANLETLTSIALNPDNTNIDYTDEDGVVTPLDMTAIVKNLETLTTIVENTDGTFTYRDEQGDPHVINMANLETLTSIALNPDNTNIDYTDEDGVVTPLDMTAIVKNLETLTTIVENTDGTFTYRDEQGDPHVINMANLETLTSIALNPDNTNIDYTDEDGVVTPLDMTAIVKNLETLTTIVENTDGTFTYRDEQGDPHVINMANLETLTSIALNPDNTNIDYTDEDGVVTPLDMTAIVKNLETLTTIVENTDGTFTYRDEQGDPHVINMANLETLTSIALNPDNTNIDYTDEDGVVTPLDMTAIVKNLETLTTIVENTDGTFTYRDEQGDPHVINMANLETLTSIALNPDNTNIDYTDEDGVVTPLDMTAIVKNLETLTTIVENTDGTFTYRDEQGDPHVINMANLETLTSIALNPDNTNIDYTDEDGVVTPLDMTAIVKNLETLTTIVENTDGTFTYRDEQGDPHVINMANLETLTSIALNPDNTNIDYTDEDGVVTPLDMTAIVKNLETLTTIVENTDGTFTYRDEQGDPHVINMANLETLTSIALNPDNTNIDYTDEDGVVTPLDMTAIVKNLETLTTIVENTDGTFTYRDEQGDPHVINMANLETLTSIALNPDNTNIDYTDEDGVVTPLDMTAIVKNLETLTTIVENTDGTFTYRDEQGDPHVINMANLETLTSIALNPDNTNIDYTDEDGVVTPLDMTAIVKNLETLTTIVENTDGTFTYRDEQGDPHVINMANLETLTSIALNPDNTNIDYTDEDGVVTPLDMTAIVKNLETLTTIVENTDGTFTYRDEQGDPHVINMANLETLTSIALNPDNTNIDYTDEDGVVTPLDMTAIVKNLETLTTIVENTDGTFTYRDEQGDPHVINMANLETLTSIALNPDNTNIDYTDEDGVVTPLDMTAIVKNLETLTTIVENTDGTFTYRDEQGDPHVINMANLETLTSIALNPDNTNIDYTDEDGVVTPLDMTAIVKNLETLTTIVENTDGTFTYRDEQGDPHVINMANLETLTSIALNPDNTNIDYTDEDGVVTPLDMTAIVKNLETLTTIVENTDGTFTYRDEQGDPHVINMANLETLTSIALNPDNTNIDYTDEDGVVTPLDMTAIVKNLETLTTIVENTDGTFTYRDEQGDPHVINMANLETLTSIALNPDNTNIDYTDEDGVVTPLDMTAIVKNLETLTTIVENTDGTFTYRDEQGDPHVINMANLETLTSIALNPDNTNIDYTDEDGVVTPLDMTAIVKNLETLTTIVENTDGTFTYRDEQGDPHVINMANLETLTTITATAAVNGEGETIYRLTYTDESGNDNEIDMTTANALHIDGSSGAIKLGGPLTEETTIETDATNTLAITGLQPGNLDQDNLLMADANGVLKTISPNKFVRFFYMPSVVFDTSNPDPTGPMRTKNLYQEYVNQFTGAGTPGLVGSTGAPATIPYLPQAEDLYYYITYYDDDVFADLSIDENGVLSYRVIGPGTPTSFMNIVFVIKE